jgi:hypothetical protein
MYSRRTMTFEDRNTRIAAVAFGLGLLVVSMLVGGAPLVNAWNQHQVAQEGVETEATVLSTDVEEELRGGDAGDEEDTPRTHYYAQVTYRYTVDGETYESSSVVVPPKQQDPGGKRFKSLDDAKSFLSNHPADGTVTAYYLPDAPETSFLVKPDVIGPALALPLLFGLPFAAGGAWLLRAGLT